VVLVGPAGAGWLPAAQLDVPGQPDDRADAQLQAAEQEHPGPGGGGGRAEEQDAADDEPQRDQEVVDDAQHFVAASDQQLVPPQAQDERAGFCRAAHAASVGQGRAVRRSTRAQPASAAARPAWRPGKRHPPRKVPSPARSPCAPPPPNPAAPPAAYNRGTGSPVADSTRADRSVSSPPRVLRVDRFSRTAISGPPAASSRRCGAATLVSRSTE